MSDYGTFIGGPMDGHPADQTDYESFERYFRLENGRYARYSLSDDSRSCQFVFREITTDMFPHHRGPQEGRSE